jgi:hypothetical protein
VGLPQDLLWHVTRRMGRRSRIVSTTLLDAYGPLDCRLVLSSHSQLRHMLRAGGHRLQYITSLQLLEQPEAERGGDSLASTVARLPGLLAPLRATLTALDVRVQPALGPRSSPALEGLAQLTGLRSLTLSGVPSSAAGAPECATALGSLPHLQHLDWFAQSDQGAWTPAWLVGVRSSLPQLTSLSLNHLAPSQREWGARDTEAMLRALAGLRSLSVKAVATAAASAAASGVLAALAQCTWLESVHLHLAVESWAPPPGLLQLSRLRLASLELSVERFCSPSDAEPLLRPLAALSRLTRLALDNRCFQGLRAPQLPSSLVELQVLGGWEAPGLLLHLQDLPALRVLGLHHDSPFGNNFWAGAAAEQLPALTQLRSLAITRALAAHGLVACLSGMTTLRELRLAAVAGEDAAFDTTDADLLRLVALRGLTCLALTQMGEVSPSGLLPLLEALPSLQHLELSAVLRSGPGGEALVQGLLPRVLPRLSRLQLLGVPLPGHVRDALLSAAEAHDCRCDVAV